MGPGRLPATSQCRTQLEVRLAGVQDRLSVAKRQTALRGGFLLLLTPANREWVLIGQSGRWVPSQNRAAICRLPATQQGDFLNSSFLIGRIRAPDPERPDDLADS